MLHKPRLKWSRETMEVMSHSKKYMVKETGDFPPESIVFTDSHRYLLVFDLRAKFLSRQEKNAG